MALFKRRQRPESYTADDDRSFAVALRLEVVAKRMALINQRLAEELAAKEGREGEGGGLDVQDPA